MLNQTNIANNNNKFYIIQLLEDDSGKSFYVWTRYHFTLLRCYRCRLTDFLTRWGRVGVDGQNSLINCSTLTMAMDWFEKKFNDKTRNMWQERHQFLHHPQKYFLVERDFGKDEPLPEVKPITTAPVPDSLLSSPLQDLIKMIFNLEMMEQQMMEVGYDGKVFVDY